MKVGIIGATGYAGVELIRILLNHKYVKLNKLSSVSFEGKTISEVYPSLSEICEDTLCDQDETINSCDVVFASLPAGLSEEIARKCFNQGKILIDLGADFRLYNEDDYKNWYGKEYGDKELHQNAIYALPELYRDQIKGKKIIGNPGCYPTSIALGAAPILKSKLADLSGIIIDSKSGTTGAGRGLSQTTHFPDCNEAFSAYKIASHRHTPEIEQTLSSVAGQKLYVTFVPHLLPVNRGILSTIYIKLSSESSAKKLTELYKDFYKNEKFVRVHDVGVGVNIKDVRYSNYCDISVNYDARTNTAVIVSVIDNMVKGAAGQAVQNMNIVCGFDEAEGLGMIPPAI